MLRKLVNLIISNKRESELRKEVELNNMLNSLSYYQAVKFCGVGPDLVVNVQQSVLFTKEKIDELYKVLEESYMDGYHNYEYREMLDKKFPELHLISFMSEVRNNTCFCNIVLKGSVAKVTDQKQLAY